jgi:hypothetical protein
VNALLITTTWWLLAAAAIALLVAALRDSTEGALPRYVRARCYHRSGSARHAARAIDPAPMSALETVPDAVVSPLAARTA